MEGIGGIWKRLGERLGERRWAEGRLSRRHDNKMGDRDSDDGFAALVALDIVDAEALVGNMIHTLSLLLHHCSSLIVHQSSAIVVMAESHHVAMSSCANVYVLLFNVVPLTRCHCVGLMLTERENSTNR